MEKKHLKELIKEWDTNQWLEDVLHKPSLEFSNKAINIALQCIALCPLENNALPGTLGNFSHFPLFGGIRAVNEATNETLIDVKKRSISFQCCLKFQKIPIGPGVMTARSCAPKLHSKLVFLLNYY